MLINKTVVIKDFEEPGDIFIKQLLDARSLLSAEGFTDHRIFITYDYGDNYASITIEGSREETTEETKARVKKLNNQAAYVKQKEIAKLKELMLKYKDDLIN